MGLTPALRSLGGMTIILMLHLLLTAGAIALCAATAIPEPRT
jgi:hypothetical protein